MPPRKCFYDVLGVPRTIDGADLKKIYRQLALKYHPDKNLENPEGAKRTFQEIQVERVIASSIYSYKRGFLLAMLGGRISIKCKYWPLSSSCH